MHIEEMHVRKPDNPVPPTVSMPGTLVVSRHPVTETLSPSKTQYKL
jgi:hypothetical protein